MSIASAADVAARVADARAAGTPLRIAGTGSWLGAGAPVAAAVPLALHGLAGIVEYEPGDLTLTALAGTTLADIQRATAAQGQWLPLDPFGAPTGTLGATVATGSYGPLAAAFGTPRNQVLGCEIVTGTGAIIRAGGRVVKNVAGFDITRLMIGAWGTLGVLTEVTVRLRARPEADETLAIALGTADDVEHARRWLRTAAFTPLAAELLSPALAERLGIAPRNASVLLLRVGGNAALVHAARTAASALGDGETRDAGIWSALALIDGADSAVLRLSARPAGLGALWHAARAAVERAGGLAHASLTRGVVRCVLDVPREEPATALRGTLQSLPVATRIVERAPAPLWTPLSADPVTGALSSGVRRVFDPDRLLNPGIMGTA